MLGYLLANSSNYPGQGLLELPGYGCYYGDVYCPKLAGVMHGLCALREMTAHLTLNNHKALFGFYLLALNHLSSLE